MRAQFRRSEVEAGPAVLSGPGITRPKSRSQQDILLAGSSKEGSDFNLTRVAGNIRFPASGVPHYLSGVSQRPLCSSRGPQPPLQVASCTLSASKETVCFVLGLSPCPSQRHCCDLTGVVCVAQDAPTDLNSGPRPQAHQQRPGAALGFASVAWTLLSLRDPSQTPGCGLRPWAVDTHSSPQKQPPDPCGPSVRLREHWAEGRGSQEAAPP